MNKFGDGLATIMEAAGWLMRRGEQGHTGGGSRVYQGIGQGE